FVNRVPAGEEDDRGEEGGQEDEPERDAVDAEGVIDAPLRDPGPALSELEPRMRVVPPSQQAERDDEHGRGSKEPPRPDRRLRRVGKEGEHDRGGDREPDQDAQYGHYGP